MAGLAGAVVVPIQGAVLGMGVDALGWPLWSW